MPNNSVSEVVLNDAKKFIINNIEEQARCLRDDGHCSISLLSGAPGIGKSDIMEQVATELEMGLNPQYLGTMLVEQFGMPLPTMEKDAKFQKWSDPDFFSTENMRIKPKMETITATMEHEGKPVSKSANVSNPTILFMDDIHLATKAIQTYFFQLLTYRSIHNKKMPDDFVMVAAGNRSIDRAGAQPIMAPIINRFYTVDVTATADDWIENFAIPNQVRSDVVSFIELYNENLQSEPLESKPWASPRSWTYMAQELTQMEKDGPLDIKDITTIANGHIGLEYAVKFIEYVELFMKWDAKSYFNGNPLPKFSDMTKMDNYTLMSALTAELLKDLRKNDWKVDDDGMVKNIDVVKLMFNKLIDSCREIIPMGLRGLILSENITSKEAALYYKLTEGNEKLLECVKEVITNK